METLLILTYAGLCVAIFKIFRIPKNKWTIPTAVLGGIVMVGVIVLVMNYNHPYTKFARSTFVTVPIVPAVSGLVVEVPVVANEPLNKGDVLFKIDPVPFELEVSNYEALLDAAVADVAQLEQHYLAAKAATEEAEAAVRATESELDRGAQEDLEQARAQVTEVESKYELAVKEEQRFRVLVEKGTVSRQHYDRAQQNLAAAEAELTRVRSAESEARERLTGGGEQIQAALERLHQAEALESEARLEFEAQSGGVNPEVRRLTAELDHRRWELEHTTVKAPDDGMVTHMALRPGVMAASLPLRPVMTFVPKESLGVVGAFWENSLQRLQAGAEAEVIIPALPGKVFKARVSQVLPAIAEGQVQANGGLISMTTLFGNAAKPAVSRRAAVLVELQDDVSSYVLPTGFSAEVAVYTEHAHHVAIMRKILLRMKSWLYYLFGDH